MKELDNLVQFVIRKIVINAIIIELSREWILLHARHMRVERTHIVEMLQQEVLQKG
jgi:hypothetical protein